MPYDERIYSFLNDTLKYANENLSQIDEEKFKNNFNDFFLEILNINFDSMAFADEILKCFCNVKDCENILNFAFVKILTSLEESRDIVLCVENFKRLQLALKLKKNTESNHDFRTSYKFAKTYARKWRISGIFKPL
ncbi:MAG: hypothetical protein K5978_05215 [Campylobacter sp.]|nr:hypothetical protein [Campylobacter sp.]